MEKAADELLGISFGDLPLAVVSQDPDRPKPGWSATSIAENPVWAAMQEDQKKLSTRSYRVIGRGAGHQVQIDRPDVVNAAITRMILELRGQATNPIKYGDTILQ